MVDDAIVRKSLLAILMILLNLSLFHSIVRLQIVWTDALEIFNIAAFI